jgi:biotin transporter BioY
LFTNAAPFIIIAAALGFLAFYIMPAALLGWLKEDNISAAFNWKTLKMTITLDYLVNWLIVGYLIGLVNSLLQWIPIIGVGITMYVGGVFSYTVFSEIYGRKIDEKQE